MTTAAIEAAFRTHPAVRDVRAVQRRGPAGEPRYSCWVVADESALEAPSTGEAARLRKWGKVFDLMHHAPRSSGGLAHPPSPAWTSSFTRQPFPSEESAAWVDETLRLLRSLSPARVLELGCGSGVLVSRLAASCVEYVGTDVSGRSLASLAHYLAGLHPPLTQVKLFERAADDLDAFHDEAFDTVIVNSVVQYFPSEAYLRRVLEGASRIVRPGGSIFVGDVRHLALLEPFCGALELHRASDELTLDEVHERIERRLATLDELVLAPAFFTEWARAHRARVELVPKRGRFINEFSAYRYEVLLSPRSPEAPIASPAWIDWSPEWTLEAIEAALGEPAAGTLALQGVCNARVERDVTAWRAIRARGYDTVGELRASVARHPLVGLAPEELHRLAERLGLRVQLSVASGRDDGRFDVVFGRAAQVVAWPEAEPGATPFNEPSLNVRRQAMVGPLLTHVQPLLDAASMPASITVVDRLPARE